MSKLDGDLNFVLGAGTFEVSGREKDKSKHTRHDDVNKIFIHSERLLAFQFNSSNSIKRERFHPQKSQSKLNF